MLKSLKKILFLYIILFSVTLVSQEPVSIHISENEGLPDVEIYDLLEDQKGFIWIAADKGLYRYDGKSYANYSTKKKRGLSVFNLKEDASGRIWCNNISGQFFYVENNSLHLFTDIKDRVNHLLPRFIVNNEYLEVVTDKGYYRVHLKSKKIIEVEREENDKEITPVYDVFKFNSSLFYATKRIYKIAKDSTELLKVNENENSSRFFTIENDLLVYVNYRNEKQRELKNKFLKYKDNSIVEIDFPKELFKTRINHIEEIDNNIWISTDKGILIYTFKDNVFRLKKELFKSEFVTKVIKDKNANYWISTIDNGLFIVANLEINKQKIAKELEYITTMVKVNNQLVYGTKRGKLVVKNPTNNEMFSFSLKSSREINQLTYSKKQHIILISQDLDSYIWNLNTNTINSFPGISSSKNIEIFNENEILFSGSKESYVLKNALKEYLVKRGEIVKPTIKTVKIVEDKVKSVLRVKRSYNNIYSEKGQIYVSYVDGVFVENSRDKPKEVKFKNESIFGIDFAETVDGIVWVSTFKNGVLGIVNDSIVFNYNRTNGLLSNQTSIIKSDGNNLWVVNNNSLQFIDRLTNSVRNISIKDELSITKVSSIFVDKHQVYVSGNNGIVSFDKKKVFKASSKPNIFFTSILIKDKKVPLKTRYQLKYRENNLDFNFNSNGFKTSENIIYHYRLLELESNWKTTTSNNVRYPSVPHGQYQFEVKAVNKNSLAESKIEKIRIKVIAPFWLQWWFYLIIMIIISHLYAVRIKQIKRKQNEQMAKEKLDNKLVLSQLENLRSQMNPHFIFNALNSIQEYILTNDKYSASLYLSDFSKLIRKYLEQSRILEVSLKEEIETLKIYLELEKNRFEENFEFQIEVAKNVNISKNRVPSLFLQPYIENSLKHGLLHKKESKQLIVRFGFNTDTESLLCEIEDNGIGREASHKINKNKENYHKSFSTSATNDRIELLNKDKDKDKKIKISILDLYDEKEKTIGTKVILTLPQ
jgi:ligand-binding sensor domain-containing protein